MMLKSVRFNLHTRMFFEASERVLVNGTRFIDQAN